jgi:hypothetical protein
MSNNIFKPNSGNSNSSLKHGDTRIEAKWDDAGWDLFLLKKVYDAQKFP